MGERLRWQITEGSIIQAVGRARAGLRGKDEPLDIHLWTDIPVPELGPIEPVLWDELEAGLGWGDARLGGVWLESIPDAARAYKGLITVDGLKSARKGARGRSAGVLYIGDLYTEHPHFGKFATAGPGKGCGRNVPWP